MNNEQPSLAFVAGSETSRAAAESMVKHLGRQQKRIRLWALTQRQGFTDEELARALQLNPSSARPRRGELVRRGMLKDTGTTRLTQSGRKATVWVAI